MFQQISVISDAVDASVLQNNGEIGILHGGDALGNAQPLLLAVGHIGSALFNVSAVAIGKLAGEFIGLGQPAGADRLLIGGVLVAPPEIFFDGSGKQQIFLLYS